MPQMRKFNTKAMKVGTAKVQEMYRRLVTKEINQREAAAIYGLGVIQVGRIARGESRAQETGAHENPVPNNLEFGQGEIDESAVRLRDLMANDQPKPSAEAKPTTSWYDLPPPEVPGEATGEGLERLNEMLKPTPTQQKVSDELDKFTKGD